MLLKLFLIIVITLYSVFGDVTVTLPNGQIRGLEKLSARNRTFYAFLQVPYAEPPLGKLRFRDPQPPKNWNGVLDATNEKTICYQFDFNDEFESENCLYVNVYTPVHPKSNSSLSVMFYIYGGGFLDGDALLTSHGPHHFMDREVVVVTVAYRLGPFGFLSTRDSVIPGNYGLKDQNMALKWVQQNIRYFGGDPTKVTIFGQSSGAVSVAYHIISKQSKGLFRAAIQQSGSALAPHGYQRRAKEYAYALAEFIDPNFNRSKSSAELLVFLQNVSAQEIDVATQKFAKKTGNAIISDGSWFAPVIESNSENAFITENMYESFECGNINKVPLIVGMTSEEAITRVADPDEFKKFLQPFDDNVTFLVQEDLHITDQNIKTQVGNAIRKIYTDGLLQDHLAQAVRFLTDVFITKPIMRQAELQSKYTDVYFYQFSYHGPLGMNNVSIEGAERVTHSEDINYLWVTNDSIDINSIAPNDLRTVDRYLKLYTDFSKTLNPTPEPQGLLENIKWPKVTRHKFPYLDIGENLNIEMDPRKPAYKEWVSIYETWGVKPFDTY